MLIHYNLKGNLISTIDFDTNKEVPREGEKIHLNGTEYTLGVVVPVFPNKSSFCNLQIDLIKN